MVPVGGWVGLGEGRLVGGLGWVGEGRWLVRRAGKNEAPGHKGAAFGCGRGHVRVVVEEGALWVGWWEVPKCVRVGRDL